MDDPVFRNGLTAAAPFIALASYAIVNNIVLFLRSRRGRRPKQTLIDITPKRLKKKWIDTLLGRGNRF
jgi:hypothetical protein